MSEPNLVGTLVADRYQVLQKLGEGGMGEVYLAQDTTDDTMVALKVLLQSLATDPKAVARFEKEALAVSRMAHPNIVAMKDYGRSEEGQLFLAMEYLEGETVYDIIGRARHLDWEESLHIARGIAAALAEAHAQGIIHRDLKPDNVMVVQPDKAVKVLDFGLAMVAESQPQMRLTESNIIMGTPGFMSPEQIDGAGVDARSDIYALGILWWQMLVGRPPFDGDTPIKVMMQHVQEKPLAPTQARPGLVVPPAGEKLILKLLEKHPDDRPRDGGALIADIRALDADGWQVTTALPSVGQPLEAWEDAFNISAESSGSIPVQAAPGPSESSGGMPAAPTMEPSLDAMIAALDERIASSGPMPAAIADDGPAPWSPPPATDFAAPGAGISLRADGTLEGPGAPAGAPSPFHPPDTPPTVDTEPSSSQPVAPAPSAMDALRGGGGLELAVPKGSRAGKRESEARQRESTREQTGATRPSPRAPTQLGVQGARARSGGPLRWVAALVVVAVAGAAAVWFLAPEQVQALLARFQGTPTVNAADDPLAVHLDAWRANTEVPKESAAALADAGFAALAEDTLAAREKADERFRQALLVDRASPRAVAGLLEVALLPPLRRQRSSLPVDALLEELERVAPTGLEARRARAAWALRRGDAGAALRLTQGLKDPAAEAIAAEARFATDPLAAVEAARAAWEAAPKSRAAVSYAHLARRLGQKRAAERALRERSIHEPNDPRARTVQAELLLDSGARARAVALLIETLEKDPGNARALRVLAQTKRKPEERLEVLATLPTQPADVEAAEALALRVAVLARADKSAQALEEAESGARLPPSVALSAAVGDAELASRRVARARSALERAEQLSAADAGAAAWAARRLGDLDLGRGAFAGAAAQYTRALRHDPGHVAAGVGLGVAHLAENNVVSARAAVLELAGVDPLTAFRRRPPHGDDDPGPDAIYDKLIPKKGDEAAFLRGGVAFLRRDFERAARELRRLSGHKALGPAARVWLAAAMVEQGRGRAAARLLKDDEGPAVVLVRARAEIDAGRARVVKAELDPLRGDKQHGRDAEVILGRAMKKMGRREAARGHLQAALGMDPEDVEARGLLSGL